jgi:hypothetical protein
MNPVKLFEKWISFQKPENLIKEKLQLAEKSEKIIQQLDSEQKQP